MILSKMVLIDLLSRLQQEEIHDRDIKEFLICSELTIKIKRRDYFLRSLSCHKANKVHTVGVLCNLTRIFDKILFFFVEVIEYLLHAFKVLEYNTQIAMTRKEVEEKDCHEIISGGCNLFKNISHQAQLKWIESNKLISSLLLYSTSL